MKTLLFDFDGVLHDQSTNKWERVDIIKGQPVPGMQQCVNELRKTYKIVIYSSRCLETSGVEAIQNWLDKYNIEVDGITKDKLPYASMIIDDRAINFSGDPRKLINDINKFVVWTKLIKGNEQFRSVARSGYQAKDFSTQELVMLKTLVENEIDKNKNSIFEGKSELGDDI